jgi:hypothetical protein
MVNKNHRCGEGQNKESKVHNQMRNGGAALSAAYLLLQKATSDQVIDSTAPPPKVFSGWLSSNPQFGATHDAV